MENQESSECSPSESIDEQIRPSDSPQKQPPLQWKFISIKEVPMPEPLYRLKHRYLTESALGNPSYLEDGGGA